MGPLDDFSGSGSYLLDVSVTSQTVYDITYQLDLVQTCVTTSTDRTILARARVKNYSGTRFVSRSVAFKNWFKCAWSFTNGVETGALVSMLSGVPTFDDENSVLFLEEQKFDYAVGDAKPFSEDNTVDIGLYVPAQGARTASIGGMLVRSTIPFTASVDSVYSDGSSGTEQVSGSLDVYHLKDISATYD